MTDEQRAAVVVGSGPAGLATAAELVQQGVPVTVLERGPRLGAAWASRYDGLRFNTSRIHSALPGAPFPRSFGQFPTRDQYVAYLGDYARSRGVHVATGVRLTGVSSAPGGWELSTSRGGLATRNLVLATGIYSEPVVPAWPGAGTFGGRVLHAADYRNPAPYAGRDVLVVGAGSTGMEIARELAEGGAGTVWLSYRTPPNILLRQSGGVPADLPVPLFLRLPDRVVDRMLAGIQRVTVGDLTPYGLPEPGGGVMAQLKARGAGTAIVDREVVDAIRAGRVRVVPAVRDLDAQGAVLADGSRVRPDVVVAATGYGTGLEPLVGHLGVLGERGLPREATGGPAAPGLWFVGYVLRPGLTGYAGRLARRAAAGIAARERASRTARRDSRPPASRGSTSRARAASPG